jgi:hypothetical protein
MLLLTELPWWGMQVVSNCHFSNVVFELDASVLLLTVLMVF